MKQVKSSRNVPDVEAKTRASDLASLQRELKYPVTLKRLKNWVGQSSTREKLLANTVWGTIRWRKSLGKPHGPTLGGGFDIQQWYYFQEYVVGPGGKIIDKSGWAKQAPPIVWDGHEDQSYYRVAFLVFFGKPWANRIRVDFSNVGWDDPQIQIERGYLTIKPPEQIFGMVTSTMVLDEFEVVKARV